MAVHRRTRTSEGERRPARETPRGVPAPEPEKPDPEPETDADLDLAEAAEELRDYEPDPRLVDSLTDRIFASVLSRYGWEQRNGRIEHVGEERAHRH